MGWGGREWVNGAIKSELYGKVGRIKHFCSIWALQAVLMVLGATSCDIRQPEWVVDCWDPGMRCCSDLVILGITTSMCLEGLEFESEPKVVNTPESFE